MNNKKILLVGSYPPPTGGCSVHIKRLKDYLDRSGYDVKVLDLYAKKIQNEISNVISFNGSKAYNLLACVKHIIKSDADILHFHVSAMNNFVIAGYPLIWASKSHSKKILTIHSGSFVQMFNGFSVFKKKIALLLLNKFHHIIVVNNEQLNLLSLNLKNKNISVIPAFMPPVIEENECLEKEILKFKEKCQYVVVSSGYGLDYYGYDQIIDAITGDDLLNTKCGLLLCLYNTYDEAYMDTLNTKLCRLKNKLVFKDLNSGNFAFLLNNSDIYIRATDRDGDAVAIREAAYFKKPVIASDSVSRIDGCRIYRYGNIEELRQMLLDVLTKQAGSTVDDTSSGIKEIINIYQR